MADACIEHDLICITDEVYEHLVFDGEHIPLATLPGMAERTLTISSVGKSFSVTGWKIGWCSGPAALVAATRTVKQFLTFAGGTPLQHAAAAALRLPRAELDALRDDLRAKRDQLCDGLAAAGLRAAGAGRHLLHQRRRRHRRGASGARRCPSAAGSSRSPPACSTTTRSAAPTLVRFAFCKRPEVIAEAAGRLAALSA